MPATNVGAKRIAAQALIFLTSSFWFMPTRVRFTLRMFESSSWKVGYPFALTLMVLTAAVLHRAFKRAGWL